VIPLVLTWQSPDRPLPCRPVRRPPGSPRPVTGLEAPPWHASGPPGQPFDFCGHIRRLCADIAARCAELDHIDVRSVLFGMMQARNNLSHGLQARVTPLRFRHGQLRRERPGDVHQVQRYLVDGREMLYLVTFCLPRFLDQSFDEKFITLFHELYHISPRFEGDLRRHEGRGHLHSHSKRAYDQHMAHLAREYLAGKPDPALHGFLRLNFAQLEHRHGRVEAVVVPRPRLVPIETVNGNVP
jgi:hypothetical protein